MAVLCEAFSVVIRRDSIDDYYHGGWDQFLNSIPNATFCTDGELARIGFLSPDAVQAYVDELEENGLQFHPKKKLFGLFQVSRSINDLVVIDQHRGPTTPCPWVEFGKFKLTDHSNEVSMCWLFEGDRIATGIHLKDTKMDLAAPEGWSPKDSEKLIFKDKESS
jgi:hypothetical protein